MQGLSISGVWPGKSQASISESVVQNASTKLDASKLLNICRSEGDQQGDVDSNTFFKAI